MTRIGILVFGVIMMASCSDAQTQTTGSKSKSTNTMTQQKQPVNKVVNAQEFKDLLDLKDRQLIDVRTADEYAGGKIDNAQNIDFYGADFKNQLAKLDKSKPVLVYCHSGGRSGKTAAMLKEMGFQQVYDLQGGYSGWPYK